MRSRSLADIAAEVPAPSSVAAAQRRLDGLQERFRRLGEELEFVGTLVPHGAVAGQLVDHHIEAVGIRTQVNTDIAVAKRALASARGEHVGRVRARLQRDIDAAEVGVAEALAALLHNWSRLDEASAVLRHYGGSGAGRHHATAHHVAMTVRKLIADCIGRDAVDAVVRPHLPARQPKQVVEHQDAAD